MSEFRNREGQLELTEGELNLYAFVNGKRNVMKQYRNTRGDLHRTDGPAVIGTTGIRQWWLNGKLHRKNGPAVIDNHYSSWWVNGKRHRIGGPAFIDNTGNQGWYVNGREISEAEHDLYVFINGEHNETIS